MRLNRKMLTLASFVLTIGFSVACNKKSNPPATTPAAVTTSLSYCSKDLCTYEIKSKDAPSFIPTVDVQPAGYALNSVDAAKLAELGLQMDNVTGVIIKQPDLILNEQPDTTITVSAVDQSGLVLVSAPVTIQLTNKTMSFQYCNMNQCYFNTNSEDTLSFKPAVDAPPAGYKIPIADDLENFTYLGLQLNQSTGEITKQAGFNLKPGQVKITIQAFDSAGLPCVETSVIISVTTDDELAYNPIQLAYTLDTTQTDSIAPTSGQFENFTMDETNTALLKSYGLSLDPDSGVISGQVTSPSLNDLGAFIKISATNKNSGIVSSTYLALTVSLKVGCPDDLSDSTIWNSWTPLSTQMNKLQLSGTASSFAGASLDGQNLVCVYTGNIMPILIESKKSIPRTIDEINKFNANWKTDGAHCDASDIQSPLDCYINK